VRSLVWLVLVSSRRGGGISRTTRPVEPTTAVDVIFSGLGQRRVLIEVDDY